LRFWFAPHQNLNGREFHRYTRNYWPYRVSYRTKRKTLELGKL